MKLIYDFEITEMGDEIIAVPVGDNAERLSGIIKLNDSAKEMLELIQKYSTPEEVLEELCKNHPEDNRNELGQLLCDFLNDCLKARILDPEIKQNK